MMQFRLIAGGAAAAMVVGMALVAPSPAMAQEQDQYMFPLQPEPPGGLPVSPFLEGWYNNGDGTVTYSFGYLNRNDDRTLHIPHGEENRIEPDRFQGMQPTVFHPGKNRGVFAITVDAGQPIPSSEEVWWYITNANGAVHRVPGHAIAGAYELDWIPRPHGSIPPHMWFEDEDNAGQGPPGTQAEEAIEANVGEQIELTVNVDDRSIRDPEDRRFRDGEIPQVNVEWFLFQGNPEAYEFSRHESNPLPEPEEDEEDSDTPPRFRRGPPAPQEITLPEAEGQASVYVTITEPGTYVFRVQADNFGAPDSSSGDQCCWSNAYQTVIVE